MTTKDPDLQPEKIEKSESKAPSRAQAAVRRATRWVIIALVIIALGFLVVWVTFISPRAAETTGWQNTATAAQVQISGLQTQVAALQGVDADRQVLSLLVDVNSARYELAKHNPNGAQLALANTARTLTQLRTELGSEFTSALDSLTQRLNLALKDVRDKDEFAALNDLEVLANSLLNLERGLTAP
jgi:hypothetical protein